MRTRQAEIGQIMIKRLRLQSPDISIGTLMFRVATAATRPRVNGMPSV